MRHPELRWMEVAVGGVNRRGQVVDAGRWKPPAGGMDVFRTVFRFGDAFREYVREHRSVRGWRGTAYADYLPIDIDVEGDLDAALSRARMAMSKIVARTDVDAKSLRVYVSGSKGFHIQLPVELFDPEPSEELHRVFARMVEILLDGNGYDPSVYDQLRLFRVAGTRHGKTGLYKTPLQFDELQTLTPEQIVELAKAPRQVEYSDPEPCQGLVEVYREAVRWVRDRGSGSYAQSAPAQLSPVAKPCIAAMMQGVSEPGRHDVALRLASYWAHQGMPTDAIEAALLAWNQRNRPPMDDRRAERELPRIAREAGQYDFGCNDPIRLRFCGGACQLKARKERPAAPKQPQETAVDLDSLLVDQREAYRRYVEFTRRSEGRIVKLGFPAVDQATRGLAPGEVCEIVARAGVGKTALLVNVAYNLSLKDMGPVLFFTMEMPIPRIFERTVQLACTVDADYVMSQARSAGEEPSGIFQQTVESFRNVWYVERDFLRYREIEAIVKSAESKIGQPAAVLIDYLGRMRPDKSGQKPYEVTSELAQKLKHLAKACDVPVIYLHQASRSSAQDGSAPLTLDSGRDSGVTEEAADVVIGLWRPDLGEGAARDTEELEMAVLKARNGRGTRVRVVFLKSFMRMGEQEGSERRVIPMRRQRGERKSGTAT